MMHLAVATLSLALMALAEDQAYLGHQAGQSGVYDEKTRFVVSPNFPYDYNGYPYNKAHAAVYQGIPAYAAAGYAKPQHAYQPQPAAYHPQQAAYQPNPAAYQPHEASAPQAYNPAPRTPYELKTGGMQYHGLFADNCVGDGLYYKDLNGFVICSNKNPSVQACAPGSRNPDQANFKFGDYYNKSDFCSINLVDLGYAAAASSKGY